MGTEQVTSCCWCLLQADTVVWLGVEFWATSWLVCPDWPCGVACAKLWLEMLTLA